MIEDFPAFCARLKHNADAEYFWCLNDDVGLLVWAEKNTQMKCPPIVRASTYSRVWKWQEFSDNCMAPADPRRPVIMRGALAHMRARRFDRKFSYSEQVVRRYLHRSRFDGVARRVRDEMRIRIVTHFERRNHPHDEGKIHALVSEQYRALNELKQIERLTNNFKRLLKADPDRRQAMAAELIGERT